VKVDSQGSEEWSRTFGGSEDDYGWTVRETSDGGYIVTGSTLSFGVNGGDVYLVKVDSQGSEEWSRTLGGSEDDFGYSVQETSDGGYIIAGFTMSFGTGAGDAYLVKVDSQGSEEWNRTFGDTDVEFVVSVQSTREGGFILAGFTYSFVSQTYDIYLVKVDPQGSEEWSRTLGGSDDEWGQSVRETSDGGYIIAGSTRSYGAGLWDVYLVKTDSRGRDEETYTASIISLEGPYEVNAGESFTVDLTVTYEFTVPTEMSPGVYDVETQTFLAEEYETLEGEGTKTYRFELTAPEEEATWALAAGVWYHSGGELLHDEVDWVESFDVQVRASNENGIPGFPYEAMIFGLLIGFYLLTRRSSLQS
jgi:hypothetical protein